MVFEPLYPRDRERVRKRLMVHLAIPAVLASFAILSEYAGVDLWIAQHFFDPGTGGWPNRDRYLFTTILHTGAKNFMLLLALANLLAIIVSFFSQAVAPYRKHLAYIFIAALTGPLVVSALKEVTHIYIPWDLALFGGDRPYIRLFDPVPAGAPVGHGFPGGHASGGFAYLSVYFVLMIHGHRYRYYALLFAVLAGGVFSFTQQVRGAHFLSHDIFSFVICWMSALLWAFVFYGTLARPVPKPSRSAHGEAR